MGIDRTGITAIAKSLVHLKKRDNSLTIGRQLFDIEIGKGIEGQATDFLEDGVCRVSLENSLLLKTAGGGLELVEDLESH